jgi:hypothetical protein
MPLTSTRAPGSSLKLCLVSSRVLTFGLFILVTQRPATAAAMTSRTAKKIRAFISHLASADDAAALVVAAACR